VKIAILIACAIVLGCGEPLPIHIAALRDDPGDEALVDEAVALLGMDWEPSEKARGTVRLALVDEVADQDNLGVSHLRAPRCYKASVAVRRVDTVAHEIGHLLGLDHVCENPCPEALRENLGHDPLGRTLRKRRQCQAQRA